MYTNAVEKLKSEIDKAKNNPYVQVVGSFLLGHLEKHPKDAEKIIVADKTITKSLDEMRKAAEKKKVGNCAVLTDQEAFSIVLKYFGIDSAVTIPVPAAAPAVSVQEPVVAPTPKQKSKIDFNVNLDDFI